MKKIIVDLENCMIYKNSLTSYFIAVDRVNVKKMDTYYREFNRFKDAPDDATVEGFPLIPDKEPNTLRIDLSLKIDTPVKILKTTWIRIGKK